MIRKALCILACCFTVAGFSCSRNREAHNEKPVARVYDQYLFPSDLKQLIQEGTSAEDSTRIVSEYIDNWIRHNLELKIAQDNISGEIDEIDKQTDDYRESLIIYAYEKQWVKENLDTVISEDSMQSYFHRNQNDFVLKSDIYQLSYAILDKAAQKKDSLKNFFAKGIDKFRDEAESFCLRNCRDYSLKSGAWVSADALFNLLPLAMYSNGRFRTNGVVEYEDETNYYIVTVDAWHAAGTIGSYEYNKNAIGDIIINKRKMELLKNNQMNMVEQGLKRNNAEIYTR